MSATILTPAHLALTTSLADLMSAPATGKVRRVDVRFANVGTADTFADLVLTDGSTTIYRAKNYPVPYENAGSAPDVEQGLVVPAGWKLQAKALAGTTVEASYTGIEADAADFV